MSRQMPHINRLTFGKVCGSSKAEDLSRFGNHAATINAVEQLLSVSASIETNRHDEFEARSKPIVDNDDAEMLLHMLNWCQSLVSCLSKPHLPELDDGRSGLSLLCGTRGSLHFNGPRAEISFHSRCQW